MEFKDFYAGENDNDRRLDKVIRRFIPELALSQIYKYIRKNLIKINDHKTTPETHIFCKDKISIAAFILNDVQSGDIHSIGEKSDESGNFNESCKSSSSEKSNVPEEAKSCDVSSKKNSENDSLNIIFENNNILILNKNYDILVHGDKYSADKKVTDYYKKSQYKKDSLSFTPGPLHRLDKKTTGLLCFSMSLNGARWFSENIKTHIIKKTYIGIVEGKVLGKERWNDFIEKNEKSGNGFYTVKAFQGKEILSDNNSENYSEKPSDDLKNTSQKNCITTIIPLKYGKYKNKDITLVNFVIETGRTHQIRSQSALHKHPLLGDTAYGGEKLNSEKQDFFLHAQKLSFPKENPLQLPLEITAPLPKPFENFIKKYF